ncbi:MAG: dephospho-CoA kinase [Sideroxydans sp.]|nr:dephospho-CoA kinase [Sideroxydans sp.]
MTPLYGLTGGIGSGKSTVAEIFANLGARIIDTDKIAHQLTQPNGAAISHIASQFGADFIDPVGAMDRVKMRKLIFSNPDAKKRLEAILHPLILGVSKSAAELATEAPYTLLVVPLLFENGHYQHWLRGVIAVDCSEQQQIERTMRRSHLSESDVQAIMDKQIRRSERLTRSDYIIHNDGEPNLLSEQIQTLHSHLIKQ